MRRDQSTNRASGSFLEHTLAFNVEEVDRAATAVAGSNAS